MKRIISVLLCVFMLCCLTACGSVSGEQVEEPRHSLEFVEGKYVTIDENEYVGVFCNYTNNSGETCIPCEAIDVKAFQNGVELNIVVYSGQETEGAIQCDTSVQSGTTTKVVWTFEAQDDSEVSVEFSNGEKYSFSLK